MAGLTEGRLRLSIHSFSLLKILSALLTSVITYTLFSFPFVAVFTLVGLWFPEIWIKRRIRHRASVFAEDYPTMLLATASSLQVGMTPYQALERATWLMPAGSLVKREVELFLEKLRQGISKEQAIGSFAAAYDLPELELFRSALLLVIDTGGRFSPTLQRLAEVSNNRITLLRMAAVSTASMRLTANVLLIILPFLIVVLSLRIENYWELIRSHPTANALASVGIFAIFTGYLTLRKMSFFKP